MFINSGQLKTSFARLGVAGAAGKSHLERTSCLMYFFALDAVSARIDLEVVDLNPESESGRINRRLMDVEFSKLILLDTLDGVYTQVLELGKISKLRKSPAMRIASNFYSVPLKNAVISAGEYYYPHRPRRPILSMGMQCTGRMWGIKKHVDWGKNLPIMFEHSASNTPFTDFAFFLLRRFEFAESTEEYSEPLSKALHSIFTSELAGYLSKKIRSERVFSTHVIAPFSEKLESFYSSNVDSSHFHNDPAEIFRLYDHIDYVESLLAINDIKFDAYKTKR